MRYSQLVAQQGGCRNEHSAPSLLLVLSVCSQRAREPTDMGTGRG